MISAKDVRKQLKHSATYLAMEIKVTEVVEREFIIHVVDNEPLYSWELDDLRELGYSIGYNIACSRYNVTV